MASTCFRLLDTLDIVGQTYFRLKHTELWASFKICEVLVEAHRLYRKWRSIPGYVEMLQSPDAIQRSKGVQELEFLCYKNTGTKAFSVRALELGALPGILSCLTHLSPTAVCAALCVLSDVYSHPLCKSAFTSQILREIFSLLRIEDLYMRLRSAFLLALLTSEDETKGKLKALAKTETDFISKMTDLICKPLPERYQMAIETPDLQMNVSTLKHLRNCESQVRKSGVALFHLLSRDKDIIQNFDMERIVPVLVRSIRGGDAGLRMASLRCLKSVMKEQVPDLELIGDSIQRYWNIIMPKLRDMETLHAIEDLGIHPELLDRLIHDVYFLHRLPNLLTCKLWSVRTMAFRSLYPFTLTDRHRWKVVRSGLLHLIFRGLFDGNKSIYISALICLSQLCSCQEVFMAVQAEITRQPPFPCKMGEYLVYLVLSFPSDDIGQGALKLLGEAIPKIQKLPRRIFANLSMILSSGEPAHKIGTAKLVTKLAHVEKFRDHLLKSSIVTDLLTQARTCEPDCKASVLEALAKFSSSKTVADRVVSIKGMTESLWMAQESDDHEMAVAALELLRTLSESLGIVPGAEERTLNIQPHSFNE